VRSMRDMPDTTSSRSRAEWLPSRFLLIPALVSLVFIVFTAPTVLAQVEEQREFEDQLENGAFNDTDSDSDDDNGDDFDNDDQTVTGQQYGGSVQTPATGGLPLLPLAAAGMVLLGSCTLMVRRLLRRPE